MSAQCWFIGWGLGGDCFIYVNVSREFPKRFVFPFLFFMWAQLVLLQAYRWEWDRKGSFDLFNSHKQNIKATKSFSLGNCSFFFPTLCWDGNAIKKRNEVKVQSWSFVHTHKKKSCVWFKVDTWLCQISPRTLHHLPSPRSYGAGSHCRRGLHCSWTLLFGHTWWFVADPRIPEEGEGIVFKQG